MGLAARLFGLSAPVDRKLYAITGFSLMLAKYGLDTLAVYLSTGSVWSPLEYLSPLLMTRQQALESAGAPATVLYAMVAWTLPFLWIGISMSVRRAADAGLSGWLGLLFFV